MPGHIFPFAEYWWFYAVFTVFIALLLGLDLGLFHRQQKAVGARDAAMWTAIFAGLALAFNFGLWRYAHATLDAPQANRLALEFLTGYIIEPALSVDNLFVFVLIFSYFGIKPAQQHRVLFYGILGAIVFRAGFIAIGSALLRYQWMLIGFGIVLTITGLKMFFGGEEQIEPEKSLAVRVVRRIWPSASTFLLCLATIEVSDILFAIDSVPAIFAVTREPLIVFTSNVFAILGLRSMYFLLSNVIGRFHLLRYGLGIVLVFIGLKMAWLNDLWDGHFPIGISLGIIAAAIGGSIVLSLLRPPRSEN
jgi:tellurite resistance protein TerC